MTDFTYIDGLTTELREDAYRIPDINAVKFADAISALNKRAKRIGVQPAVATRVGDGIAIFDVWDRQGNRTDKVRCHYVDYVVTGEKPVIAGWAFVATIQHAGEAGNVLRTIPGVELPEQYRNATPEHCDHCGMVRNRKDTYIVRNVETGEYRQVGSSCLRDFTGTNATPEAIARRAGWLFDFAGLGSYGRLGDSLGDNLAEYLTVVSAVIRDSGWLSKSAVYNGSGYGIPTAQLAEQVMHPFHGSKDQLAYAAKITESITESDTKRASATIDYVRDMAGLEGLNDYLHNLTVVIAGDYVPERGYGLAASAIPFYMREMEKIELRKVRESKPVSQHIGAIGGKIETHVTIVSVRELASDYGTTLLVKMADDAGNDITWFASGNVNPEAGQSYTLRGTVKKHDTYNGQAQTVVTRCKLV